jgi:predicted RND superfamily exporter protein
MIKFGRFIAKHHVLVLIIALLLLIPSIFGYAATRVNYDILTYLPEDIDTMVGQDILMDEFGKGAFSMVLVQGMEDKDVAAMREEFSQVDGVADVMWYDSIASLSVPKEILPDDLLEKFSTEDSTMMVIFFEHGTSSDETLAALDELRAIAGKDALIGGMTSIIADTKTVINHEMPIYVVIAAVLSCLVLGITMESLLLPILILLSIGMAIIYNMGTNIVLGEISYITMALAAVLQLGVTTDYSIFLWHSYKEQLSYYDDCNEAMAHAIAATFSSVLGSSMTTVAGFIALCFMSFTLGFDMGIVMAKGVVFGVIGCVTILPSMILLCRKGIEKTTHRPLLPDVGRISTGVVKHYKVFIVLFLILLGPALYGYNNIEVYYKLDTSLPEELDSVQANAALEEDFNMGAMHLLLLDSDTSATDIRAMSREMEQVDGVSYVLGVDSLVGSRIPGDFIPSSLTESLESEDYKLMLIGSEYVTASDEVNAQITELSDIIKSYDEGAMLIGEAPCTKDLITITDHDFAVVNSVSIVLVFLIIAVVLRSVVLPILLVAVIEFAIFINLGIPGYTGTQLPFIASIVISTIQLGATVDYAILMTNRYLHERTLGKNKKEAVTSALSSSATSILVSAMSFFAATFGVGLYSEIDLIGTLCALMARGALISMVVVLLVLPSVLYLFDKFIIATTFGAKRAIAKHTAGETV